jgi:hypothetical protein
VPLIRRIEGCTPYLGFQLTRRDREHRIGSDARREARGRHGEIGGDEERLG